jgi:hypothetical protein
LRTGKGGSRIDPVSESPDGSPIDVQARMDSFFGIVDLCREVQIGALESRGMSRSQAEAEWRRLRREAFINRDRPPFSRRFPKAGIWRSR